MLKELDLFPLAYITAKSHGLEDEAASILEASGMSEDQLTLPKMGEPIAVPQASVMTHSANWPVKSTSSTAFEKVLLGQEGAEDELAPTNGYDEADLLEPDTTGLNNGGLDETEEDGDAEGWDMGEDVEAEAESDFVNVEAADAGAGSSEADMWARSPIAADLVAAGAFEAAMQMLNRQVGAVNFKPLQWRFEEVYQASRTFLPANPGLQPLVNFVRRTVNETNPGKVRPLIPRDLESILTTELVAGKTQMRTNKLEDGVKSFQKILHLLLVNAVSSPAEESEVCIVLNSNQFITNNVKAKKLIYTATQYTIGMSLELERRKLINNSVDISTFSDDIKKRALELSAYFTTREMDPAHVTLALFSAMNFAHKNKQFGSALSFANSLIEKGTNAKFKESVSKL
jgi:coatomer protein complex subunit alpha (xenin)